MIWKIPILDHLCGKPVDRGAWVGGGRWREKGPPSTTYKDNPVALQQLGLLLQFSVSLKNNTIVMAAAVAPVYPLQPEDVLLGEGVKATHAFLAVILY